MPNRSTMMRSEESHRLVGPNVFGAIVLGVIGYLIVSLRQPLSWSMPVWIGMAFIAIPLVIGISIGAVSLPGTGAFAAFFVGAGLMFCYTAIGLIRTHAQLAPSPDRGQIFLVGFLVSAAYGIAAGIVASGVNITRFKLTGN